MVELKSHEFEGFIKKTALAYRIFLVYGPDRGLVSERAAQLAAKTGISLDDPFSVLKCSADDVLKEPGRLVDEAQSIGLFGGQKLIWLRDAGNDKQLVDAVSYLASHVPDSVFILLEAGDLKKGALLRKTAESARSVLSIPCYADDTRALNALIDSELAHSNLRITPEARQTLIELIGGDRIASRNELKKLALYAHDQAVIDEDDIIGIIGDASAISVDEAVDAVFSGDAVRFTHAFQKINASKTSLFLILQACLKQFQLLDTMRTEMDQKSLQPAAVLQTMGRQLHFRRKPIIERALRQWKAPDIAREMNRLQAAIFQSRKTQSLEESIAFQTLLAIALQASRKATL